ncbi:MAG: DUF2271 domain-containing protein [Bacteroides sp.]|nr:DUF2271 domain-containing protein [Bacteroides sp.]
MRTTLFSLVTVICLLAFYGFTTKKEAKQEKGKLEIAVEYNRQAGRGSNQYAVWIEDNQGNLVKTLYVTRFTAEGGYKMRPTCMPVWVEKSGAASMDKSEIDGFSGATPQSGTHIYTWDGTDKNGQPAPQGEYTFVVEATYIGENIVTFKNKFNLGGSGVTIPTTPGFNSDEEKNRDMITRVTATYIP